MRGDRGRRAVRALPASVAVLATALLAVPVLVPVPPAAAQPPAAVTEIVVDSAGDEADLSATDQQCRTALETCTLRAAITEANERPGRQRITFAIGGPGTTKRIQLGSRLPILTDPDGAEIDGTTQAGAVPNSHPWASNAVITVELRGNGPQAHDGIQLGSPGNVVRGLALFNLRRAVFLLGPEATGNQVLGSFIGTDASGTFRSTTYVVGSSGVIIQGGASANRVGGPDPADRNVLSGNSHHGVASYDNDTDGNVVQGNLIGLAPDGVTRLANRGHGVDINTWSAGNLIGGSGPGEGNAIAGNDQSGVEISHGSGTLGNRVVGNRIGTTADGTSAPASLALGQFAVNLEGWSTCGATCPPDSGENTVTGNVLVNSLGGVMSHKGEHGSVVAHNRIGVLDDGTPAPNAVFGVRVEKGSFDLEIGPGNVIAHNGNGIQVITTGSNPASPEPVATRGIRVVGNELRDNGGLGIDLEPLGAVTTSPGPLVNDGSAVPTFGATHPAVTTLSTCPGCTVEVALADGPALAHGEGRTPLATAVADGAGVARVALPPEAHGEVITATSTTTGGSTSEFARNVAVPVPAPGDQPPTAAASASCTELACTFSAAGSSDPEGALEWYRWDFGDGATGEGATATHRFDEPGSFSATLTVVDRQGATATATTTATPTNQPPTAAFTATCTYQICTFDGGGSTDPDGTVAGWAWTFGDGTTGEGRTVTHTFPDAGTYAVGLTATDASGLSGSPTTRDVTVDVLPQGTIGLDRFSSAATGGWAAPLLGGAWSYPFGPPSSFSSSGGRGLITIPSPGQLREAVLPGVVEQEVDVQASVSSSAAPTGWGVTPFLTLRRTGTHVEYRARLRLAPNGLTYAALVKLTGTSTQNVIGAEELIPGLTAAAGTRYVVRAQALGTSPTLLRMKVWPEGTPEPSAWTIERTDAQAGLQQGGHPGVGAATGSSHTTHPTTLSFDDVLVRFVDGAPTASATASCSNRTCTLDGGASTDPEGLDLDHDWSFPDGSTATGAQVVHTFGALGPQWADLTVTDVRGLTDTRRIDLELTNAPPTAVIGVSCYGLTCQLDSGGSADPDGEIASVEWYVSDGGTHTGATATHTAAEEGELTFVLTVTDADGATDAASTTVEVADLPNQPPSAAFSASCSGMACSFDPSASVDLDGTITSYRWVPLEGEEVVVGPGGAPSGGHTATYTWPGRYLVRLEVTDDDGATATATRAVDVTATGTSTAPTLTDDFQRNVVDGWGPSSSGPAWTTTTGLTTALSVDGERGTMVVDRAGGALGARLLDVASTSTGMALTLSADKAPTGWGQQVSLVGRRTAHTGEYRARVRLAPGGVHLAVTRLAGSTTESTIGPEVAVPGLAVGAGRAYRARVHVVGTDPTTIRARAWAAGTPEPSSWQVVRTDATPSLQGPGSVGVHGVLSSSTTNAPVALRIDDVEVGPPNGAPAAAASATCDGLACTFEATATDPDGDALELGWALGDGGVALGPSASRTYAEAGAYPVTLTARDPSGALSTATTTVVANRPPTAVATATCGTTSCTLDASTSTDPDGQPLLITWAFADGTTAEGVVVEHAPGSGTEVATATATDPLGGTSTAEVLLQASGLPAAVASASCDGLTCTFDATASSHPEGRPLTFAWDLGDGTVAEGPLVVHGYGSAGERTVTLTATDDLGRTGTATVVAVANRVPEASATVSCAGLTCTFDASGSTDPDGQATEVTWALGDGTTAQGATATHTYAQPGSYRAAATVSDPLGGSSTASGWALPDPPAGQAPFATDAFGRTSSSGWGTADSGAPWTTTAGSASASTVAAGVGRLALGAPGASSGTRLLGVSTTSVDVSASLSTDVAPSGFGQMVSVAGRRLSPTAEYRVRFRFAPAGEVWALPVRLDGSYSEVGIGPEVRVPGTVAPGQRLRVRVQVTGTAPTTIRARAWLDGASEPATWLLERTDAAAALQGPGSPGFHAVLSSSAAPGPVLASVDDVVVATANRTPTAALSASCDGLTCSFDASASTDPDGPLAAWDWTFGDGSTGSGATTSHTFGSPGTYVVSVVVRDPSGAAAVARTTVVVG